MRKIITLALSAVTMLVAATMLYAWSGSGGGSRASAASLSGNSAERTLPDGDTDASADIFGLNLDNDVLSLFRLNFTGAPLTEVWKSAYETPDKTHVMQAWLMPEKGKIGVITREAPNTWTEYFYYMEYDLATGTFTEPIKQNFNYIYPRFTTSVAYNPDDGCIYGYAMDGSNRYTKFFAKAKVADFLNAPARPSYNDPSPIQSIVELTEEEYNAQRCGAFCYQGVSNCCFGLDDSGNFVRVDLDGTRRVISSGNYTSLGMNAGKTYGMVWSPAQKCFIFAGVSGTDDAATGSIWKISLDGTMTDTGITTPDTLTVLMTSELAVDGSSPLPPTLTGYDFPEGANEGTVDFTLPLTDRDGNSLSGQLDYILECTTHSSAGADKTEKTVGSGAPGKVVAVDVKAEEPGYVDLTAQAISAGKESQIAPFRVWAGKDVPMSPGAVAIQIVSTHPENPQWGIAWMPVTEGIHKGYVNPAEMNYEIYIYNAAGQMFGPDGKPAENKPIATVTGNDTDYFIWNVPQIMTSYPKTYYYATVKAVYNGNDNGPTSSIDSNSMIPFGGAWEIGEEGRDLSTPLDMSLWTYQKSDNCQVLLNATDVYGHVTPALVQNYAEITTGSDAWLFTPAVTIKGNANGVYALAIQSGCVNTANEWQNQCVEAFIGDAPIPTAMTRRWMELTPAGRDANLGYLYTEQDLKDKYIGIHITQGARYGNVSFTKVVVAFDGDIDPHTTLMPPKIRIEPNPDGQLKYKLYATCPDRYLDGNELKTPQSYWWYDLKVYDPVTKKDIPLPERFDNRRGGDDYDVLNVNVDDSRIQFVSAYVQRAYVENGLRSITATASDYIGYAMPGKIRNMKITPSKDNLSATVTWDAPENPISGGIYNPEKLKYVVSPIVDGSAKLTHVIDSEEYSFNVTPGSKLTEVVLDVYPVNGDVYTPAEMSDTRNAVIGTPWKAPLLEDFEDNLPKLFPVYTPIATGRYADGSVWSLANPAFINPEMAVDSKEALIGTLSPLFATGASGLVELPKFSTENLAGATLNLNVWTGEWLAPTEILIDTYGLKEPVSIGTIPSGDGYQTISFALPDFALGQKWVAVRLRPTFPALQSVFVMPSWSVMAADDSGIVDTEGSASVAAGKGCISFHGCEGRHARIFTLDGVSVFDNDLTESVVNVDLRPGVYIVTYGDRKARLLVR